MAAEPARVTGTLCNARIEKGHIAYPCTLGSGHENNWGEPHYAIEVASSVRAWRAWHAGMETEAANEQAKIDVPADADPNTVSRQFAAVHHPLVEEARASVALDGETHVVGPVTVGPLTPVDLSDPERLWQPIGPTKQRAGDQVLPTPNEHPDIQSQVVQDIEARRQVGIQRYGTALQPFNGRDALQDAYEEALDLCMYLKQLMVEREGQHAG